MFQVKKIRGADEILVTNDAKPEQVLLLANINELSALHQAMGAYLDERKVGEFIGSATAQNMAREAGYEIPITTLVNSCSRGTIPGAHKKRGRWYMPKSNFEAWFAEWKAKKE